ARPRSRSRNPQAAPVRPPPARAGELREAPAHVRGALGRAGSAAMTSAAIGPAAIVAAALAVPLFYVPGGASPFADPKLALPVLGRAIGISAALVAGARGAPSSGSRSVRAALVAVVV